MWLLIIILNYGTDADIESGRMKKNIHVVFNAVDIISLNVDKFIPVCSN